MQTSLLISSGEPCPGLQPGLDVNQNKSIVGKWQILSWEAQEQQCKEGGRSVITNLQEAGKVPAGCWGVLFPTTRDAEMNCASLLVRRIETVPWPMFDMNYWGLHEIWKCFGQRVILETEILTRSACRLADIRWKLGMAFQWSGNSGPWGGRDPLWSKGSQMSLWQGFCVAWGMWLSYNTFQNPLPLRVWLPVIHVGCSRQFLDKLLWDFMVTWDYSQRK